MAHTLRPNKSRKIERALMLELPKVCICSASGVIQKLEILAQLHVELLLAFSCPQVFAHEPGKEHVVQASTDAEVQSESSSPQPQSQ